MAQNSLVDPAHQYLEVPEHPLTPFFRPGSVAVIGATETPGSVGKTLMRNLIEGGYEGKLYPVNPKYKTLFDLPCFSSVEAVEKPVDLAIVVTPARTVPEIIRQCGRKKIPGAVIISAGFKELGPEGKKLEDKVLEEARQGGLRLIGPNCLGIMNPLTQFNATFAASMALKGHVAFVSQSGAMCTAVLDWSLQQEIGFSSFVSIGSMADINWGDLIDYLGRDPETRAILMYMESIGNAKDFISAAREVALSKPIIVIKAGRTEAAAKAAASHTGALSGSDEVFDTAMKRAGVLRVTEISELFDMAEVLAKQPTPSGPRLAIVTNAGGPAVLAADAVVHHGAEVADLKPSTIEALSEFLPEAWSHGNPVDILGDATAKTYAKAVELVSRDPEADGILAILAPQDMTDPTDTAQKLTPFADNKGKPILASWMGGGVVEEGVEILSRANIPTFAYPDSASEIFAAMWRQSQALKDLYETPEVREKVALGHEREHAVDSIIQNALQESRELLSEEESKRVLSAYGIPVVETAIATTSEEAVRAAEDIGYPVVLKLHSKTVTHKSDVGGVILNLSDREGVKEGFQKIQGKVSAEEFDGVAVQKMIKAEGTEVILGSSIDPQFGPVILFGSGGKLVEIYRDRALGLPPLNATLARRLMRETKVYDVLKGVRGEKSVDMALLEKIVMDFSELIVSHPNIAECDINPLSASSNQIVALDARIVLSKEAVKGAVIRPYPSQYASELTLKSGETVIVRPIRPEDEPMVIRFHEELSQETVRARYFEELTFSERTSHHRMIRICHSDYDREILLVAILKDEIIAAARLKKIPLSKIADFKLVIIDRMQGQGLGTALLKKSLEVAKEEGIKTIETQILRDNTAMEKLLKRAGFALTESRKHPRLVNASLTVQNDEKHRERTDESSV